MAELTITAANVAWVSGGVEHGIAGEAVDAGQVVTGAGTSSDKYLLATGNAATAPTGIALCKAYGDGGRLVIIKTGGVLNIGATLTVGTAYFVGLTDGSIGLESDLLTGDWAHLLGFGKTAANLELDFASASSVKP